MQRLAPAILLFPLAAMLAGCFGGPAPVVSNARQCLAALDAHAISYRLVELSPPDGRCHIDTAVRVSRIDIALNQPAIMSCALATRIDDFERAVMQRIAVDDLGKYVSRIDHLGAYSCRSTSNHSGRLSEHALGLAIDISGFRLTDGTVVSVEHDWWAPGPKRDFLHHLAKSACGYFSVVLTPSSDRDHFNHMHFDIGPDRLCSV
ncbi:MAG TPA: extensin family protein [Stellaceae bacterium]|nr:extensin family protein [Stellaceae bacterium]